ncbi:hypothetical protein T07_14101, partial [Trichinella nelsoni]
MILCVFRKLVYLQLLQLPPLLLILHVPKKVLLESEL